MRIEFFDPREDIRADYERGVLLKFLTFRAHEELCTLLAQNTTRHGQLIEAVRCHLGLALRHPVDAPAVEALSNAIIGGGKILFDRCYFFSEDCIHRLGRDAPPLDEQEEMLRSIREAVVCALAVSGSTASPSDPRQQTRP
ncbi:MAG: hypothetical protein WCV62_06090 [Candidatus Peribacteraceae bacterium]|jgi:hypothetical protein